MQSHNLEHKSAKRKRAFRRDQPVAPADVRELKRLFPGGQEEEGEELVPRVKRSVHARKKRRKVLDQASGYWGLKHSSYKLREGAGREVAHVRLPRPQDEEADAAAALDRADQRRRAPARPLLQPVHLGPQEGGDRARPQDPRRPRRLAILPRSAGSPSRRKRRWPNGLITSAANPRAEARAAAGLALASVSARGSSSSRARISSRRRRPPGSSRSTSSSPARR